MSRLLFVAVALTIVLALSLALNWALFVRAKQYYVEVNLVRLDPLGLGQDLKVGPNRSTAKPVVAFFGDSRAAQWPSPTLANFEFINRGVGGQTSAQTLLRFDYQIPLVRPDIIIVQVGINDLKTIPILPERKGEIVASCKHNIEQIVAKSNQVGAMVVLVTIFPVSTVPLERRPFWSPDVDHAIEEVNAYLYALQGPQVIIFDAHAILSPQKTARGIYADELHLDIGGYEVLNKELAHLLSNLE